MGGLKRYLPVTYATMLIGTLAIAGIPPLSGFFSKDEILFRSFLSNKAIWVIAVVTAMMTAFYMFRLISMTFFGPYRGPAWEVAGHGAFAVPAGDRARDTRLAAAHGARHPADMHAHGHAHEQDHELAHGPAEPHDGHDAPAGHGHGPWHGPHESPAAMTYPLMALAVGAIVAGFVGIPGALGGSNTIERFLDPSFTATATLQGGSARLQPSDAAPRPNDVIAGQQLEAGRTATGEERALEHAPGATEESGEHASRGLEWGLMALSVAVAIFGILLAWRFYVTKPEISEQLAERYAGAHRLLTNKYYVDELYDATVISGGYASGRGLWSFDRNVVDGVINGTSWVTVVSAWFSGLTDRTVVDGIVNFVGRVVEEGSFWFRRFQTGLVQNYALLMLFGIFAFVSIYLFVR